MEEPASYTSSDNRKSSDSRWEPATPFVDLQELVVLSMEE